MRRLISIISGLILTLLLSMSAVTSSAHEGGWHAWVLMPDQQWLMLINDEGSQYQVQRPLLTGESSPNTDAKMVISRDGRYLLIASQLDSGDEALGIVDLATETLVNTFIAGADERFLLGSRYFDGQGISGSSLIFSPDSQQAVVGLVHNVTSEWRMWVVDLPNGIIIDQLHHADLPGILATNNQQLSDAATMTDGFYFPRPVFYDNNGGIHTQLLLNFAGGAEAYPAFVWYPDQNSAQGSPYVRSSIDVYWQNTLALFTHNDPNFATLPPAGPFEPHNAVAEGNPIGDVLVYDSVYANGNFFHYSAHWIDFGTRFVVLAEDAGFNRQWAMATPNSGQPAQFLPAAYEYVHPVSNGILAVSEAVEGFFITYIEDIATQEVIWNAPPMAGYPVILWAQMPGCGFGVEGNGECVLQTGDGGGLGIDAGISIDPNLPTHCEGTPPSINAVNTEARVTFTDGRPLNVRITPGGTILAIQEEGQQFTIIGGPECQGGFTWWNIQLRNGAQGWVAEGDFDDYYIEPMP